MTIHFEYLKNYLTTHTLVKTVCVNSNLKTQKCIFGFFVGTWIRIEGIHFLIL